MTRFEIEKERHAQLRRADIADDEDVGPGTFSCHEAMHMTAFFMTSVEEALCNHPSVLTNPEWYALSREALNKLFELYRTIGNDHTEAK